MDEIIIYDTEFWTDEGVMSRGWGGLHDHPPMLIQIGAYKVKLDDKLTIVDEFISYVWPQNEHGDNLPITPFFTDLTHITPQDMAKKATALKDSIQAFKSFSGNLNLYSFGRDDLATIVPSCYLQGIENPFNPKQMRDIRHILLKYGIDEKTIYTLSSGTMAAHFGIILENHHAHDARDDAFSILAGLRALIEKGQLHLDFFREHP